MGFIYKNIPAFNAALGDTIAFDVNIENNTAIQLDIALAATTTNGGFTPAGTFTKVASNTQTPSDPNGNNVIGDYELLFTFENSFSFTGGGLIIQFSNPSSLYSSDTTPTFNIVGSVASDASNFFVGRYYNDADGIPNSIDNDSFIGNFRLTTSLDAPTDLTLSANSITENVNTTGGIEIGGITITDPNAVGNNNVLSVEGIDAANFEIRNGTKLFFIGTSPDFETKSVYSINLKTTDGSLTYSKAFAIAVTDVDEFDVTTPTDTNAATNTIAAFSAIGTVVGITANATDADGSNNTVTYTLTDNAGGRFAINSTTGVVTVADGTLLNFETATSQNITVQASSSDGSISTQTFAIAVTDVDEFDVTPPIDSNVATNTIAGHWFREVGQG
jgi:hypothetical protein